MGSPAAATHQPVIPPAVKRHIDRANALAEEINKQPENPQPESQQPPENPPQPESQQPQQPQQPQQQAQPDTDSFEHKYKVLQGKYNAEVPRLQRQLQEQSDMLRQQREQLTSMQTLLASLNHQRSAPPKEQPPATTKLVKDEEIEQFGSDLFDFVRRAARQELVPEIEQRIGSTAQRIEKVERAATSAATTVAQSAQQRTVDYLASQVPDWEQVNENPEFLTWLEEVDPYSGQKRHELLLRAYKSHDGPRVVAFFKGFLNENAVVEPPSAPAPAPAQATQERMAELVAPGAPKGTTSAPTEAGKRVWTQREVAGLYGKINEFTKRGRPIPDELRALERDLFKAQTEGRVRP